MRGIALFLWGLGVVGSVYYGQAAVPALEASYRFSADRWRQGRALYETLEALGDPVTLWVFREAPAYGRVYLLFWKVLGGFLLVGFLLRKPSREEPPTILHGVFLGLIGGLYQVLPYTTPFAVGETACALALWLGESAWRPFAQGILLSVLTFWHPVAGWALIFWLYRCWEEQSWQALLYHLLGFLWGITGILAIVKAIWGAAAIKAYFESYVFRLWSIGIVEKGLWLLGVGSAIGLLLYSGEVGRRPYRERVLFRRVLWAGLSALGWGGRAFPGMALFLVRSRDSLLGLTQILLGFGYLAYGTFLLIQMGPTGATLSLAPGSCFLGVPAGPITLEGPYGCDLTVPYDWRHVRPDLEKLYQKLQEPLWIYDAGGYLATYRYYLPRKLSPYQAVDTNLPGLVRLYQRGSETSLPWLRIPQKKR